VPPDFLIVQPLSTDPLSSIQNVPKIQQKIYDLHESLDR
jgi:hypothetical protein